MGEVLFFTKFRFFRPRFAQEGGIKLGKKYRKISKPLYKIMIFLRFAWEIFTFYKSTPCLNVFPPSPAGSRDGAGVIVYPRAVGQGLK